MVRVVGTPIVLMAAGLCLATATLAVQDSPITHIDSPAAWKKFLEKMANSELDYMNSEESENQEAIVKSPKEETSGESLENSGASVETDVSTNSTNTAVSPPTPNGDSTLFHHLFKDMNKDLANVFSMIVRTAAEKQWWRGQNVCVDRQEKIEHTNDTESASGTSGPLNQFFSFGAAQFSSCRHSPSKYVCTTTTHQRTQTKTVEVTYQCCYGFRRIDNKGQCVKVDLKPMTDLMADVGGAEFMKMVKGVDMSDVLEKKNITVFVPNDEAIKQFESEIFATNNVLRLRRRIEDNDVLTGDVDKSDLSPSDMVLAHVIPGLFDTNEMSNEEVLYSENHNTTIRINIYPGEKDAVVTANCAEIKSANNPSTAGLVHVVSKVLKPVEKSLVDLIRAEPSLSMFSQMLENANLTEMLTSHSHVTVFAPSNAAFEKMESGMRNKYLRGQACIKSVLKHHIIPHTICSAAIPNKRRSTIDLNGEWLSLERDASGILVVGDKAHTERSDLMSTNGVVHIVNKVMQPKSAQPTSQILSQANHTTWLELVQKANLLDMIDQTVNLTMFVPSESALNDPKMKEKLSGMKPDELRDLIMYHAATPKICTCEMENDMVVNSTLPEQTLQINVFNNLPLFSGYQPRASVQCARMISTDEKACETVAHEIDRVLEPPSDYILNIIRGHPNLTIFSEILKQTKTETELSDGRMKHLTLLAPPDETFKLVGEAEMKALREDKDLADVFVRKHMLEDFICCSSVGPVVWPFVNEASNLADGAVEMRRDSAGRVHFGPAIATDCDNIAKDGVIHFINKPLIPRSVPLKNGSVKITDPNGMQILLFGI